MRNLLRRRLFRRRLSESENAGERAGMLCDQGYNCAQAVLLATTGRDDPELLAICDAFGNGLQGSGCLCGAVNGGVVALAILGRRHKIAELVAAFRERHRSTCCKVLTAPFRWNSPEHHANCRQLTMSAAEMVARLARE